MADGQNFERLVVALEGRITQYERSLAQARRTTDRQFSSMERRAKRFQSALAGVGRNFAAALGVGISVRGAQALIDASTRITNALKVAGLEGAALTRVYDSLYASAQRNAAPLESLVELYGRASQVQKELGVSTSELLNFTDKVALALRVSGKSAQESSGALLQLSQALGSGVVRAEEWNSIMEGALPIAQAAAAGLEEAGGSVAKLRSLVVDGKVSSEAFFRAFEAGAVILEEKVAGAGLTTDASFTLLTNTLIDTAREFDDATGLSRGLTMVLADLADIVKSVGDAFRDNAQPIGDFFKLMGDGFAALEQWKDDFRDWAGLTAPGGLDDFLEGTNLLKGRIGFRSQQPWDDPGAFPSFSDLGPFGGTTQPAPRRSVSLSEFKLPDSDTAAKAAKRHADAVKELVADLEHQRDIMGLSALEQEIANTLYRAGVDGASAQGKAIRGLIVEIDGQRRAIEDAAEAMRFFGDTARAAVGDFIADMVEGKSVAESFAGVLSGLGRSFLNRGLDLAFSAFIPGFASGTNYAPGGLAVVGENGPELINLPRGSRVFDAAETAAMLRPELPMSFAAQRIPEFSNAGGVTIAPTYQIDARGSTMTPAQIRGLLEQNNRALRRDLPKMLTDARRRGEV